ncbi:hypothetical protein OE88DRAFT_1727204 [Heliocybe sulcata]|uniref:Uncharacterized protein n=1 Tax=Heliocybe sulcata TaxID=5364 RepID=A0A5C3MZ39_9AGAM|nr:hypothetical protein OE88DRAFT_1727204 [Heliocybe sulcata]
MSTAMPVSAQLPQTDSSSTSALMPRRLSRSSSARYPSELSRNPRTRVPLQTRTDTYERLEDLLREAGYKETRVFTPEAERYEEEGESERRGSMSMGAVVDFITGLMGTRKEEERTSNNSGNRHATPALVHATPAGSPSSNSSMDAESSRTSSLKSHHVNVAYPERKRTPSPDSSSGAYQHLHRELPHTRSIVRPKPGNSCIQALPPSRARAYLRHMASAPHMPQARPASSNAAEIPSLDDDNSSQPPLPPTWLEVVTKAVLGSGVPGAHLGGPGTTDLPASSVRRAKSKRSHSALSDRTNRTLVMRPTIILTRSLSSTAPVVSTTQVVCQSAPASRCPSRTPSIKSVRRGRGSVKRPRDVGKDRLPSLASTCVEGDALSLSFEGSHGRNAKAIEAEYDENESSDEEEGEIDLARLLVPPKRQHSIKSLRRHLHRAESATRLRAAARYQEDEDGFEWCVRDGDGEEDAWTTMGTFERAGTKRRRAIPSGWVQWTGSRA